MRVVLRLSMLTCAYCGVCTSFNVFISISSAAALLLLDIVPLSRWGSSLLLVYGAVHCSSQVFRTKWDELPSTPTAPLDTTAAAEKCAFAREPVASANSTPPKSALLTGGRLSSLLAVPKHSVPEPTISAHLGISMLSSSPHDMHLNHAAITSLRTLAQTPPTASAVEPCRRQNTNRVFMIVPTCFEWNADSACDNLFQAQSWSDVRTELSARYGSTYGKSLRDVQHILLDQFSALHREVTSLGIDVLLYTHLPVHR
jgi:hypothetical protein